MRAILAGLLLSIILSGCQAAETEWQYVERIDAFTDIDTSYVTSTKVSSLRMVFRCFPSGQMAVGVSPAEYTYTSFSEEFSRDRALSVELRVDKENLYVVNIPYDSGMGWLDGRDFRGIKQPYPAALKRIMREMLSGNTLHIRAEVLFEDNLFQIERSAIRVGAISLTGFGNTIRKLSCYNNANL